MSDREEDVLKPIEERQVEFYDDQITAALVEVKGNRQVYVPLRPICTYLGLDWSAQSRRLQRDIVLKESQGVAIMATPSGSQKMLCLPLELLPGWLFGIDASRVKPELKDKIVRYQRECFRVLWQAFQTDAEKTADLIAISSSSGGDDDSGETRLASSTTNSIITEFEDYEAGIDERLAAREPTEGQLALIQIREMGLSIARMAEQQLEIERKADRANERLDAARDYLMRLQTRFDQRITALEDRLYPPADYITEEQVARLQLEVKALAQLLTSRDRADKKQNHYQGIFNELYRRYGVSSYTRIRIGQYETVMQFLADWKHASDSNISDEVFLQGKLF